MVYVYTSGCLNIIAPSLLMYNTNRIQHIIPRCIHTQIVYDIVLVILSDWFVELSLDIFGVSITARELHQETL